MCFCGSVFHEVLAYCNRLPEKKVKSKIRPADCELIKCEMYCKIFCQLSDMEDVFINKNIF